MLSLTDVYAAFASVEKGSIDDALTLMELNGVQIPKGERDNFSFYLVGKLASVCSFQVGALEYYLTEFEGHKTVLNVKVFKSYGFVTPDKIWRIKVELKGV
jgi:hypothetical protein